MYNHKKTAAAPKSYEKLLIDNNESHGLSEVDNPGSLDWLLQRNHKDKDNTVHYQKQLEAERGEGQNAVLDKKFDEEPKLFNLRRTDKAYAHTLKQPDQVAEAWDQKHYRALREADDGKRDTLFWDKLVGLDVNNITKIVKNKQKSQLANHPDRFEGLDKTMPINESYQEDAKAMTKTDKMYNLVAASLRDADAMLFHLFAKATGEDRHLTQEEGQQRIDINAAKERLVAFANGKAKQHWVVPVKKAGVEIFDVYERFFKKDGGKIKYIVQKLESFPDIRDVRKAYPNATGSEKDM
jgi:hypothetical protein